MQTESAGVGSCDAGQDHDSAEKAASDKSHSDSMHTVGAQKGRLRWLRNWAAKHKGEIFWGLVFAWVMARFVFPPAHEPYYVPVVEYTDIDEDTANRFDQLQKDWLADPPMLGDVPIRLKIVRLSETDPEKQKTEAKQKSEELAAEEDTLMVVGHLPSGLTGVSLLAYLGVQPPVPYISTTASADNLCANCPRNHGFRPLLQPSPRNRDEAKSMLLFAKQKQKKSCLVVTDQNPAAADYSSELGADLSNAVDGFADISIVATYRMELPPTEHDLQIWKPDCVLYAGHMGTAETLWNLVRGRSLLMVFSDGVIETRRHNAKLDDLNSAFFTYATDAAEAHNTLYAEDAVGIAKQLLKDLNSRGGDISYRLRSLVHLENVKNARNNLVRVMEENSNNRTWYPCKSSPDGFCIFDGDLRKNGLFHVWQLDAGDKSKMKDIDGWHQPKDLAK